MLSKDLLLTSKQLSKNLFSDIIVVLCSLILFLSLVARAENSSVPNQENQDITQELKNSLGMVHNSPNGQTPFQALESKVKNLGYTLDSFMPEADDSTSQSGDSILETVIQDNVARLINTYASIDGIKKSKNLSEPEKKEKLQKLTQLNNNLNKGLNEIKSRYSDKFKETLQNKMNFIGLKDCTLKPDGYMSCEMLQDATMSELKAKGLIKNSALAKAFSEGALKGLLDPKLIISEEEYNQRNNIGANIEDINDEIEPVVTKSATPKNAKDCATKSLDIYRKKIESISKSDYVGFVTEGQASPCRLLRLSYTIQEKPFKRILKEGTIFDWNNKVITLDQKAFDGILQSWGVLNGAKSSKPVKNKVKSLQKQSNRSSGKR